MKRIFLLICLVVSIQAISQTHTIIDEGIYKSYFSSTLKEPLYVVYHLYNGGGKCDRRKKLFQFTVTRSGTATPKDYAHSGFEEGHLANAEDFANDCVKEAKRLNFSIVFHRP
jgi:DNA/RNA endonuclease G (NUC1)